MIDSLLKRLFSAPTPEPLEQDDSRLALAALLVRLAKIDEDYADAEIKIIDRLIEGRYSISNSAAAALRIDAEEVEKTCGDTVHLTRLIKEAVPYIDRYDLVVDLWRLVLADGRRDHQENSFLRLVSKLVGVNDRDSGLARQDAAKG